MFVDQRKFMTACGQTVDRMNEAQTNLYLQLTLEELSETLCAANPAAELKIKRAISELRDYAYIDAARYDRVELFDGVLDVLVTTIGIGLSAGFPLGAGWQEVTDSNMSKVDPVTGKVLRRDDGKILKPAGFKPPNLAALV